MIVDLAAWPLAVFRPLGTRVLRLLDDPVDRSAEIADLAMSDPGLALALVVQANSLMRGTGAATGSVAAALQVLGRTVTRSVVELLVERHPLPAQAVALDLHRHALVASLLAGGIARLLGTVDVATARTAALLHDLALWRGADVEFADHARLTARMLKRAGFPDAVVRAVAAHHGNQGRAQRAGDDALASVLEMADRVAAQLCPAEGHDPVAVATAPAPVGADRTLALTDSVLDRLTREVGDGLLMLGVLLGVPRLGLDGLGPEFLYALAHDQSPAAPPAGACIVVRRELEAIRRAPSEVDAVRHLLSAVRDTPNTPGVLLVLDAAGHAILDARADDRLFSRSLVDVVASVPASAALFTRAARTAQLVVRGGADDAVLDALRAETLLVMPLRAGQTALGFIVAPGIDATMSPTMIDALAMLAMTAGTTIETLQLARPSYLMGERLATDGLTGVLKRDVGFDRLAVEVRTANRYRRPLAVVMVDLDNFKDWNDSYGHQVGDRLLADISKVLRDTARETDIVCRYGGDEFMAVLPGCGVAEAQAFAERVRVRVESLGKLLHEASYAQPLSVSLGVTAVSAWPVDVDALIFRADHALYQAKKAGRNRVHAESN